MEQDTDREQMVWTMGLWSNLENEFGNKGVGSKGFLSERMYIMFFWREKKKYVLNDFLFAP